MSDVAFQGDRPKPEILGAGGVPAAGRGGRRWFTRNPLAEFVDRDLRNLADTSKANWRSYLGRYVPGEFLNPKLRLINWIDRTLPEKYTSKGIGFQPWYLWRFKDDADPRFLLLLVQQRGVVPG